MNIPSPQAANNLLSYFSRHPLGKNDSLLLERYILKDYSTAQTAFEKIFNYGYSFPACIQRNSNRKIFLTQAGPIVSSNELAVLAQLQVQGVFFLIENQVNALVGDSQAPVMLQFDNFSELQFLLDSEGVISKKLTDYLVGEYFFFAADGVIAKYAAFDQIEPVTAISIDEARVSSYELWLRECN
jgi:hypothetical protein